jgi:hypothetical protein
VEKRIEERHSLGRLRFKKWRRFTNPGQCPSPLIPPEERSRDISETRKASDFERELQSQRGPIESFSVVGEDLVSDTRKRWTKIQDHLAMMRTKTMKENRIAIRKERLAKMKVYLGF